MRYGYWMPVFGGWLRNVDDEKMAATLGVRQAPRPAQRADRLRPDARRRAEPQRHQGRGGPVARRLVHGRGADGRDRQLELMVAVRPTFHNPALLAKQAANIDHIGGGGRLSLNVVSSWWADEATKYGVHFEQHDDRYARTAEWLEVVDGCGSRTTSPSRASTTRVDDAVLQPKPVTRPRPVIYAGGESEAAKNLIAETVRRLRHARRPAGARSREKIADMTARREQFGLPPMIYGVAAYSIVRDTEAEAQGGTGAHHRREAIGGRLPQLSAVARRHAARTAGLAGGLLGLEPRPAVRPDRHAGAGARPRRRVRGRRRRLAAAAMQPAAGGDGALRRDCDTAARGGHRCLSWRRN